MLQRPIIQCFLKTDCLTSLSSNHTSRFWKCVLAICTLCTWSVVLCVSMLVFCSCVRMHACTCTHLRASAHHPSHQLVVWHHVTMAPGLWRPVEACSTMPTTHTQKQKFSLAFRERERHANSGSQAGEPPTTDAHIHTGASVIHASGGLRSGELTSLDRHRHSTEQRNIHGQECSAAFRENEEEKG